MGDKYHLDSNLVSWGSLGKDGHLGTGGSNRAHHLKGALRILEKDCKENLVPNLNAIAEDIKVQRN